MRALQSGLQIADVVIKELHFFIKLIQSVQNMQNILYNQNLPNENTKTENYNESRKRSKSYKANRSIQNIEPFSPPSVSIPVHSPHVPHPCYL